MKLAIIGFGHMGSAIIAGALRKGVIRREDTVAADSSEQALERASALGIKAVSDPADAVKGADAVILAVKPNNLGDLSLQIKDALPESAIIVSICAGKRIETLEELFGNDRKFVRVMPNTPALVGEGMSALCKNGAVTDSEMSEIVGIFSSLGRTALLPESLFDTVTAVSGSGPAYVYSFICALMSYAEGCGMSPEDAKLFAAQTTLGAAKLALESDESPEKLKQNICTPGGTTVEAVKVLNSRGFEDILKDAAKACEEKSRLLAK